MYCGSMCACVVFVWRTFTNSFFFFSKLIMHFVPLKILVKSPNIGLYFSQLIMTSGFQAIFLSNDLVK